ncbi:MAG TPA: hypothetical protein PLZ93_14150 [Nocardioides sp.]|uniref:hypothetical protein n=1 Tax=uncultured Nocardioides sp. TaxID=198441 RepID=UPI00262E6C5F|nr:hypothetical protein [uncultured Nocardioides sp.]HRI96754.1 hypothetical protein [Nocardioides sp.]HRK46594.1 hypothetical protein [Nocardioides sp.]
MVEIVSWFGVAVIALFALVGFVGVVATSVLTLMRYARRGPVPVEAVEAPPLATAA